MQKGSVTRAFLRRSRAVSSRAGSAGEATQRCTVACHDGATDRVEGYALDRSSMPQGPRTPASTDGCGDSDATPCPSVGTMTTLLHCQLLLLRCRARGTTNTASRPFISASFDCPFLRPFLSAPPNAARLYPSDPQSSRAQLPREASHSCTACSASRKARVRIAARLTDSAIGHAVLAPASLWFARDVRA